MAKRTNKAIASVLQLENDPKTQKCYNYNLFFISIINFSIFLEFFSFYIKLFWCCLFSTDGCFSVHVFFYLKFRC